jgi:hypothetical protein
MAGITNDKLLDVLNEMKVDIAEIKGIVPIVNKLNNDAYIGNGDPPWKVTCREYLADKKAQETAKTVTANNRLDFSNKVKLQIIGGLIAFVFAQFGLVVAAINWIPKLFPALVK